MYNMVGFQTKMTYPEQRRVLRMIPALEKAEFVRLGSIHRNTFVDSPRLILPTLQLRARNDLFLAGQMVGVEGYVESAAAGLLAGINAANFVMSREMIVPPPETAIGSLVAYITDSTPPRFPADERELRPDARPEDPRAWPSKKSRDGGASADGNRRLDRAQRDPAQTGYGSERTSAIESAGGSRR